MTTLNAWDLSSSDMLSRSSRVFSAEIEAAHIAEQFIRQTVDATGLTQRQLLARIKTSMSQFEGGRRATLPSLPSLLETADEAFKIGKVLTLCIDQWTLIQPFSNAHTPEKKAAVVAREVSRRIRATTELSEDELACAANITSRTIRLMENAGMAPSLATLVTIASVADQHFTLGLT